MTQNIFQWGIFISKTSFLSHYYELNLLHRCLKCTTDKQKGNCSFKKY